MDENLTAVYSKHNRFGLSPSLLIVMTALIDMTKFGKLPMSWDLSGSDSRTKENKANRLGLKT